MFREAFSGLYEASKETSIRIEIVTSILALIFVYLGLFDFIPTILCVGLVMTTEIVNTVVERICDEIESEYDENIGKIKDMSAGAVLFSIIIAGIVTLWMLTT